MITYSRREDVIGGVNDRILVPYDDSEPARKALREALETFGSAEIIVFHVIELDELSQGVAGLAAEELEQTQEAQAAEAFDEAEAIAERYGVTIRRATGKGDAAEAIVEEADEYNVDHVVMGSHGRSGLSRILLGSVAEAVVRDAPVSVTISRQETGIDE